MAVTRAIGCEQHEAQSIIEPEFTADDKRQLAAFGFDVCAHHAGEGALVGNRQCRVAQLLGARHQLLGMRSTPLEAEVGEAVQLGVEHWLSSEHAMHEPFPAAVSLQPQLFTLCITTHEVIAADLVTVPPSAFDSLGSRD